MSIVIKRESAVVITLLVAIIIDSLLSNLNDVTLPVSSAYTRLAIFSVIAGIALAMGLIITKINTDNISKEIGPNGWLIPKISKAMKIIQYVLTALISAIVIQSIFSEMYFTIFLSTAITLSYVFASALQALLAYKLIKWHRYNKNPISLLYLASTATFSVMALLTIIAQSTLLHQSHPLLVTITSVPEYPVVEGVLAGLIQSFLTTSYMIYPAWLLASWGAATLMMRKYAAVAGVKTFWLLIGSTFFIILIGTLVVYWPAQNIGPFDPILIAFRLTAIISIIAEGLLLGFVFHLVSRNSGMAKRGSISTFTRLSSYGVAILFGSLSANLAFGSFPPFSAISWSFAALGSYLFLSGIYSSAVRISTDLNLKKSIRKILIDRSGFIDSVGAANIDIDLEEKVISVVRKESENISSKTGLNMGLNELEIKGYLHEVLVELGKEET